MTQPDRSMGVRDWFLFAALASTGIGGMSQAGAAFRGPDAALERRIEKLEEDTEQNNAYRIANVEAAKATHKQLADLEKAVEKLAALVDERLPPKRK